MIIRTDVNAIPVDKTPAPSKQAPAGRQTNRTQQTTRPNKPITQRSLGDAMSIAQISQNLIQRALSISIKLKNIANDAISTGKIDMQGLNEALTDINNTLGGVGEVVTTPVKSSAAPTVKNIEIPDLANEIRAVRHIAMNIKNGRPDQTGEFDALDKNLYVKLDINATAQKKIAALINSAASDYAAPAPDARELTARIKTSMDDNPQSALAVQGNISHHAAARFFKITSAF